MGNWISKNMSLSNEEMKHNAFIVYDMLTDNGWSKNAICAFLANAEDESGINAGAWQNYKFGKTTLGFGLVQWTPATKILSWLKENGYEADSLIGQVERVLYELKTGTQYYKTKKYNLSFKEFSVSEKEPEWLAMAFMCNYERPANMNQIERMTMARNWFDFFGGDEVLGVITGDGVRIRKGASLLSDVITQKNAGDEVEVLETNSNNWVKVRVVVEGYVHKNYIK